jgi:hypothetical protein
MRAPFSAVIAISLGIIVLLGYFVPIGPLISLRIVLLDWAVILAGVALLVGVVNLFYVHWKKTSDGNMDSLYSAVTVFALLVTIVLVGWFGPTHAFSLWIFDYIQVPVESSLMAVLAITLAYASARLLRRRIDLLSVVFLATTLVILLATAPIFGIELPGLGDLRDWIAQVPATAGARGILLGVALGIIATGLRVLMGADRPYGG